MSRSRLGTDKVGMSDFDIEPIHLADCQGKTTCLAILVDHERSQPVARPNKSSLLKSSSKINISEDMSHSRHVLR